MKRGHHTRSGRPRRDGNRLRRLTTCLVAAAAFAMTVPATGTPSAPAVRRIVTFTQIPADAVERFQLIGVTHAALFEAADSAAVIGPAGAMRAIAHWPDVVGVESERTFTPLLYQSKMAVGVDQVHAGAAPLGSKYTGKGVTVAVVDTGVASTHPDLADRVAVNVNLVPAAVLDPISDGNYSKNLAEVPIGLDELNHGTAVAGILAGTGESARGGDDMRGVAPEATLVNLDYTGAEAWVAAAGLAAVPSPIWEANLLAAYQWLIDHQHDPRFPGGIRVVSNSWGGTGAPGDPFPLAMNRMLASALDAGIILVFAAGNLGPMPDTVTYPGSLPSVITVGSICKPANQNDATYCGPGEVSSTSGRGPAVDVVAPGVDIWSASAIPGYGFVVLGDPAYPLPPGSGEALAEANNRLLYGWLNAGTSFATPHVSGIVALMLEANPALTHEEIESILQQTATDLGPVGFDEAYGFGRVDALGAVAAAEALRLSS